jgi:hypothetical protein
VKNAEEKFLERERALFAIPRRKKTESCVNRKGAWSVERGFDVYLHSPVLLLGVVLN